MDAETVDAGLTVAEWFTTRAGIVALVLAVVSLCQLGLSIYRDRRHKEICRELGEHWSGVFKELCEQWVKETGRWNERIGQIRQDTKDAFDQNRQIAEDGSETRERIVVALTQVMSALQAQEKALTEMARDFRDGTRTRRS